MGDGGGNRYGAIIGTSDEWELEHERDLERLARLRPIDDDLMRCIFRDNLPLAQDVLRTITKMEDLVLVDSETQRDLRRLVGARSVELDVWGKDSAGRWHDLEIQRGYKPNPKRARYHASAMDIEALDAQQPFDKLPEQWVIFIMEHDPFGAGEGVYLFERLDARRGMALGDGSHILYANGSYREDDELGRLMHDFCQSDPADICHPGLRERVEYLKSDPKGVAQMCEILEQMRDEAMEKGIEKGIEKGREEGMQLALVESVRNLMETLHLSSQQALDALRVPEADQARYLALL